MQLWEKLKKWNLWNKSQLLVRCHKSKLPKSSNNISLKPLSDNTEYFKLSNCILQLQLVTFVAGVAKTFKKLNCASALCVSVYSNFFTRIQAQTHTHKSHSDRTSAVQHQQLDQTWGEIISLAVLRLTSHATIKRLFSYSLLLPILNFHQPHNLSNNYEYTLTGLQWSRLTLAVAIAPSIVLI